jgi:hypothetical protein
MKRQRERERERERERWLQKDLLSNKVQGLRGHNPPKTHPFGLNTALSILNGVTERGPINTFVS